VIGRAFQQDERIITIVLPHRRKTPLWLITGWVSNDSGVRIIEPAGMVISDCKTNPQLGQQNSTRYGVTTSQRGLVSDSFPCNHLTALIDVLFEPLPGPEGIAIQVYLVALRPVA
jgi:hypothetical protein